MSHQQEEIMSDETWAILNGLRDDGLAIVITHNYVVVLSGVALGKMHGPSALHNPTNTKENDPIPF